MNKHVRTVLILSTLILIFILLNGCASHPAPPNKDCDKVASFAKGVSMARAQNIPIGALDKFIVIKQAPFPINSMKKDVYKHALLSPEETYKSYYSQCDVLGLDSFNQLIEVEN